MYLMPEVSDQAVPTTQADNALNSIAIACGLALVVLVCMATAGLDTSVGFF
jgi:hypothetical protein